MSEARVIERQDFWLFHSLDKQDLIVLRKFIDPEIDLTPLIGIDKIIDKLHHIIK